MKHAWPTLVTVAATLAGAIFLCARDMPLGVPGEWTWARIPVTRETSLSWLIGGALAGLYTGFVSLGASRVARHPRLCVGALALVAFGWLFSVQAVVPGVSGFAKTHFILYYPRSSGYFWQARYEVTSTRDFLEDYEQLLSGRDYLHIGTHPPGLTIAYRGLLTMCEASPSLLTFLRQTQPRAARDAAASIQAAPGNSASRYRDVDVACVWLAALITQAAAALAVIPIYGILRQRLDRTQSWLWTAFWPVVPALSVFWPKSDVLYPLAALLCTWLWTEGWRGRRAWTFGLAGFIGCLGMQLSLALAPVALMLAIWSVLVLVRERSEANQALHAAKCVGAAAGGFLIPVALLWFGFGMNSFQVWAWNFRNHALFYDHNARTYFAWLLVNPIETAFAAGWPLAVLALLGMLRQWRSPEVLAIALVWGFLWVSGKNMGEAARLWIVLLPWLVVCAAWRSASAGQEEVDLRTGVDRSLLAALFVQAVGCVVTVTTVDGFHFAELAM